MTIANPHKTFVLKTPIEHLHQTYSQIAMRKPRVKDLRHISGPDAARDPIGAQSNFLGALSELPPAVFEEMELDDADQFTAYADSFIKTEK